MNRIKVVYLDGSEQETAAGARAEVEFERKFDMAFSDAFHPRVKGEPRGRQEWTYYLTWVSLEIQAGSLDALADQAAKDKDFNDWLARVDEITVLGGSEQDPTRRERRPAKSSNSAS